MKVRGLRYNIGVCFMAVVGFILVLLWLLQVFFLESFYKNQMHQQIVSLGNDLLVEYNETGKTDFSNFSAKTGYENNVYIMEIVNKSGTMVLSQNSMRFGINFEMFMEQFSEKVLDKDAKKKTFSYTQPGYEEMLVYSIKSDDSYFLVCMKLAPIKTTVEVIKDVLLLVTIFSLGLGLIVSYVLSDRLASPITKINSKALELANGNYDVVFDNRGYLEVKSLADTLNYASGELKSTNELRRSILSNVGHDLKTPLTIIKSYAEMIKDFSGNNPLKREEHLNTIVEETDRLTALVSDILVLSKLEAKAVKFDVKKIDISACLRKVLNSFEIFQIKENYKFTVNIKDDLFIMADERRIEQVLYNLIGNAINYTGNDKELEIILTDELNDVVFMVKDSGKGISEEKQKVIWDQYYRDENNHQRSTVGTGLGLSIVKNILTIHGFEYGVKSVLGKGSTFYFKAPREY